MPAGWASSTCSDMIYELTNDGCARYSSGNATRRQLITRQLLYERNAGTPSSQSYGCCCWQAKDATLRRSTYTVWWTAAAQHFAHACSEGGGGIRHSLDAQAQACATSGKGAEHCAQNNTSPATADASSASCSRSNSRGPQRHCSLQLLKSRCPRTQGDQQFNPDGNPGRTQPPQGPCPNPAVGKHPLPTRMRQDTRNRSSSLSCQTQPMPQLTQDMYSFKQLQRGPHS